MPRRSGGTTAGGVESVADAHPDGAVVRRHESGDQTQQRGLAAAARAEQGHELAVADLQAQVADGGRRSPKRLVTRSIAMPAIRPCSVRATASALTGHAGVARTGALGARPRPRRVARAMAAVMMTMVTMASAATGSSAPVSYRL